MSVLPRYEKHFEELNPIDRYKVLQDPNLRVDLESTMGDSGEVILLGLYAIDQVLKERGEFTYHFYIMDDASVYYLLKKSLNCTFECDQLRRALILIDEAKLIYRFTAAKKFKIEDDRIQQLRLNSWGREYIKTFDLTNTYKNSYLSMYSYFLSYFEEHRQTYTDSMKCLLSEITEHTAMQIQTLNRLIEIKLLS
ncbi:hypothetical protein [Paenibacillus medicaginis]|uniref:Uncharacterized protein n=1 Tax=Paenibacillus medicaginis TaxID=1470560 RepID=A0ABV5C2Z3_9BACL